MSLKFGIRLVLTEDKIPFKEWHFYKQQNLEARVGPILPFCAIVSLLMKGAPLCLMDPD